MPRCLPRRAVAVLLTLGVACGGGGGGPSQPTSTSGAALVLRLETAHFSLYTDSVGDAALREAADRLEANLPRVMSDLGVTVSRPMRVEIWQDPAAFAAELRRYFGRDLSAGGYVTGPDGLRMLAGAGL